MKRFAITLLLSGLAAATHAQEFTFGGYGTLGFANSDNRQADYLVDAFKPNGPGYTRATSWDADTRLGVQGTAHFTPTISAVVQLISEQDSQDSYRPTLEWANVKWQATPDLSLRVGRVVLPVFMATDSRRVGYANPWVRPPVEMYSLVPVTHSDGVDVIWRSALGGATNTLQALAGRSEAKFPNSSGFDAGDVQARDLLTVNDTIEIGFLSVRAIYGQGRITIDAFEPYFDAFRMFGPPGAAIAQRYNVQDRKVEFVGLGASYDPGQWFVMGEAAKFDTHSVIGAKKAWYLSGGYRFGKFTPYLTYAQIKADSATTDPGLPVAFLPPEAQPVALMLNALLNQQLNILPRQKTASVGVRWDVMKNVAVKAQYDQVDIDEGSTGTFGNIQPGFQPGGRVR
ncbi:MAG TPA: porin, partial [Myxococcota bacterium]|nr:porin [Myxococcota bacterium]